MNKFLKSRTFQIGLATGIFSVGVFVTVVSLASTIKYNAENPRKQANDFAQKITNLAFSSEAFDANSDYQTVKNSLVDSNNQIKDQESAIRYFSYFTKNGENLEKIDLSNKEYSEKHLNFRILEIIPDDINQNFLVKFQVSQALENGDVANSDIFQQTVAFAREGKFLIAEFNSTLKKITDKLNEQIQNLTSTKVSNFVDQKNAAGTNNTVNPASLRPIDFQNDLNTAINSSQLNTKLASYFPTLKNLVDSLNALPENKIPNDTAKIFDFSFVKDRSTYQFVGLQDQIPVLFLEANLTNAARNQIGESAINLKPIINVIKIVKKNNSSYFLDLNDFIKNLNLKNPEKTDFNSTEISKIFAQEFLAKIKSGFFGNQTKKSMNTEQEIKSLLTTKELKFDFGKFKEMFKTKDTTGLGFTFDTQKAFVDPVNKTSLVIPYEIAVHGGFFAKEGSNQEVATKKGELKLIGFKSVEKSATTPTLPAPNSEIFKQKFVEGIDKAKERQALFDFGGTPRSSLRKLAKEEFEELFKAPADEKKLNKLREVLAKNYDFNFAPYFSLVDSWTGKLRIPTIADIQKFTKDQREILRNKGLAVLDSREFLRDGHQVASFFQDLLTKDQKTIVTTLFELTKKFGLLDESKDLPEDLLNAKDNLFSAAKKITLTNTTTEPNKNEVKLLSFNDVWTNFEEGGIGFYGTLGLPQEIKSKVDSLTSDSVIFAELKKESLVKKGMAKPVAVDSVSTENNKKLTESTKFTTFGDILLAFFLKAAQFDNFSAWAKLDDNLKYTLVIEKGNELEDKNKKETVDEEVKKLTEAIKKTEGTSNQGKKAEGAQNQGKKSEGAQNQGKKAEGAQNQGKKAEGAQNQGKKSEGAQNQGKKSEGAQNQGKKVEGAQNQGKKEEYLPVNFKFRIEYANQNADLVFTTPPTKMFLELESEEEYKKNKVIRELDEVISAIPQEFSETTLEATAFDNLKFPKSEGAQNQGKKAEGAQNQGKKSEGAQNQGKKAEGAQNQGKKAEGAQNQGKKAEGAQNQGKKAEGAQNQGKKSEGAQSQESEDSISVFLPELGKKIDDFLTKNYSGKNYKTKVESIESLLNNQTVKVVLFRLQAQTEGAQNQGSQISSLKFKIIVNKGARSTASNISTK
ncbi:P97 family adhesin [Mycoplasma sp. 'Moose RK']|uniref:P97 family adhesin n=1 Tax=Mycoplasma sp. 'Moose RK' TaxID=2780095 RepID=UPI0018C2896E|nr:adhesin [Mycoplasma sp. 'Moose RK']MBG0730928.1 adhesin [Mycoplasma sp. 'Moose RK']